MRLRFLDRHRLRDPSYRFLFDHYKDSELVALDTELTSLNLGTAEILSIGAVRLQGNQIFSGDALDLLIKPNGLISRESIKVHHLRHIDLDHGLDPRVAIAHFLEFIGARPLVGYFLQFDIAVLNKYVRPWLGIRIPNRQIEISSLYHQYVSRRSPTQAVDLRFGSIIRDLEIPPLEAHNARSDAIMTAMAYIKLNQEPKPHLRGASFGYVGA